MTVSEADGYNADILAEQKQKLRELFPEIFSEDKIDWSKLRTILGDEVNLGDRYGLGWKGKSEVFRTIQEKTVNTLHPAKNESVDWDTTQNLFIEGDNLEALKVLHKAYYGKVKLIYTDPPYNTGNDFVYNDDFRQTKAAYDDEDVNATRMDGLRKNTKDNGHYHSNWLDMMYPRLFLAKNLLSNDGVIFVSIDDNEVHNLRLMMNEIFGEENFIAQLVWEKGRKNDAKLISTGHEYMLLYARNLQHIKDAKTIWREPKPGAKEIWDKYLLIKNGMGEDYIGIENQLKDWYKALPSSHPSRKLNRYKHIDRYGPWRDSDISWPGGGGPQYDVIHPITKQPCVVPERGWRFATAESMRRQIQLGLVVFRDDHTLPPIRKAHLFPPAEELIDDEIIDDDSSDEQNIGLQVMPSVIYKQSQVAVKYLRKLMGDQKVFNNPKDHEVLGRLINYVGLNDNDIVLDFFAGSGTTAEAVGRINSLHNKSIQWIMVQLPEVLDKNDKEQKPAYDFCVKHELNPTIADVAMERIRRASKKIEEEQANKTSKRETPLDLGFRVYKLGDSNFKKWNEFVNSTEEIRQQMLDHLDSLESNATDEDILTEVLLKRGITPTVKVENSNGFYYVPSESLVASLTKVMTQEIFEEILKKNPSQIVLLDQSFKNNLGLKTNLILQAEQKGVNIDVL